MGRLFEKTTLNGMVLRNRFVRSATWEGMATEKGAVTDKLIETISALAGGGVGLIITSHAYVLPEGQAGPWQMGVYEDGLMDGLREMTAAVHAQDCRIVMQMSHSGHFASEKIIGRPPLVVSNFEGLSPSPREEMSKDYLETLVNAFAHAAIRAKGAGFDGVQIHAAHGYLLSQFLSPLFNRRQDEYGGDIQNRARMVVEVYRAVRRSVGADYPVLVKLNCRDFKEGGLEREDALFTARMLAREGLDALELSGALTSAAGGRLTPSWTGIKTPEQEAYFRDEARAFKKNLGIPLFLVGGIRSFDVAEQLVEDGVADYISMSRPLIREPDLINRWKNGDRRKALCKSDNLCFIPGREGRGIYCLTEEREREKT